MFSSGWFCPIVDGLTVRYSTIELQRNYSIVKTNYHYMLYISLCLI